MNGYVYAIECGDAIKIGYTRNPDQRFNTLQTGSPHECRLIGVIEGTRGDEADLHQKYRNAHIRSEWFHKSSVLDFLDALQPPPKTIVFGVTREMAEEICRFSAEDDLSREETVIGLLSEATQARARSRLKDKPESEK